MNTCVQLRVQYLAQGYFPFHLSCRLGDTGSKPPSFQLVDDPLYLLRPSSSSLAFQHKPSQWMPKIQYLKANCGHCLPLCPGFRTLWLVKVTFDLLDIKYTPLYKFILQEIWSLKHIFKKWLKTTENGDGQTDSPENECLLLWALPVRWHKKDPKSATLLFCFTFMCQIKLI